MSAVASDTSGIGDLDAELLKRKSADLKEKLSIFQQELGKAQQLVAEASS